MRRTAIFDRRQVFAMAAATYATSLRAQTPPSVSPIDLTGTWTNGSYTFLWRPKELKSLVMTPADAEVYEAPRRALNGQLPSKSGTLGQAESEFNDQGLGLARIRGEIRTSWITDPADGQVPYIKEVAARLGVGARDLRGFDNPEDRDSDERCMTATGAGAPIMNSHDTNFIQVVQTPTDVVILTEKNHDIRIVRVGAAPWRLGEPRRWMGSSVGHWEGATLVVETAGFPPGTSPEPPIYLSEASRVTERFTRTGPDEMICAFRIEDPSLFTQAWGGEILFRRSNKQIYEFACHEGNYSLPAILAAARHAERTAADGSAKR